MRGTGARISTSPFELVALLALVSTLLGVALFYFGVVVATQGWSDDLFVFLLFGFSVWIAVVLWWVSALFVVVAVGLGVILSMRYIRRLSMSSVDADHTGEQRGSVGEGVRRSVSEARVRTSRVLSLCVLSAVPVSLSVVIKVGGNVDLVLAFDLISVAVILAVMATIAYFGKSRR